MSVKDVFPRLNTLEPGFLMKDSISFARANGMYNKELENPPRQRIAKLTYDSNSRLTRKSKKNRSKT